MLKEEFSIFQDTKNAKTTIVIRNMSQKTFEKITKLLLGDVKTYDSVSGLEEVRTKDAELTDKIDGMTPVTASEPVEYGYGAPSIADTDNTKLYYPDEPQAKEDGDYETYMAIMNNLWETYDEQKPEELLTKFVGLYYSPTSCKMEKKAAGEQIGALLTNLTNDPRNRRLFFTSIWICRKISEFSKICLKLIEQKGAGANLAVESPAYDNSLIAVLNGLSDEEIRTVAVGLAAQFKID